MTHAGNKPVTNLPLAGDRIFYDLDTYLVHRKKLGAIDRPYYQLLGDGRFELIKGRKRPSKTDIFTRDQLERKFGFD